MGLLDRARAAIALLEKPAALPQATKRTPRLVQNRVLPDLSIWNQFQRIGGGLTPQQVSVIIREADTGQMRTLMDLANEVRQKDCHLQSVLAKNEEAISGLEWELELPDKASPKEREGAEWMDDCLRADKADFPKLVAHHAGAVYYGRAISEILYDRVGAFITPVGFLRHAPRRFSYAISTGALIWRDEHMPQEGPALADAYPNKFIISQPRVTGDVPCREGLVRTLVWAALFRNWTLSDWLKLGEIAWKPWRQGKYKKEEYASQEDIDGLVAILEGMSTNGVAVYPDTVDVEVDWPTGSNSTAGAHASLFDVMAKEMSKAVLGETETTQSSVITGVGQSVTHNEIRKELRDARARSVASDISRDLIIPAFKMNFGESVRPPRLRFLSKEQRDFSSFASGVKTLVDAGVQIPESWVLGEARIPEPDAGDRLVTPPPKTPTDGQPAPGKKPESPPHPAKPPEN